MRILSALAALSMVTALSASALADASAPTQTPAQGAPVRPALAEVHPTGTVSRYIVGPAGHVRGFMLQNGTVVFTGRAGDAMAANVAVGQTVQVDGKASPSSSNVVLRAKVYGPHGAVAAPSGGGGGGGGNWKNLDAEQRKERRAERRERWNEELAKLPAASLDGTVQTVIAGRKGRTRSVILSNGANVVLERSLSRALDGRTIKVGEVIHASGKGGTYKNGAAIEATELTFSDGTHVAGKPITAITAITK
jgi:hypothetical protein